MLSKRVKEIGVTFLQRNWGTAMTRVARTSDHSCLVIMLEEWWSATVVLAVFHRLELDSMDCVFVNI
jgi:hypothetical protein